MSSQSQSRSSLGSSNRKIKYRLIDQAVSILEDQGTLNHDTIQKARDCIKENEELLNDGELNERIAHPSENLLNSKILLKTSNFVVRCAGSVSGNINAYDPDELAANIRQNPGLWSAVCLPNKIPNYNYLYGTFLPGPPAERPKRVRRVMVAQQKHAVKKPENVKNIKTADDHSDLMTPINKFIMKYYKNNDAQPINYLKLVLDPQSFSRSIENIYNISFLVRDGLVSLLIDEKTGIPVIKPVSKEERVRDANRGQVDNNTFIFSLDMEDWEEGIKALNINEPFMKLENR